MATTKVQVWAGDVWRLAGAQHGVVARRQLLALGLSAEAIRHRIGSGRLHPLMRGVYAVGRPTVPVRGRWMAAVLACGPEALLSHRSAAALWELAPRRDGPIEVVVPTTVARRRPELLIRRRTWRGISPRREVDGIPVTDPITTLTDFTTCASSGEVVSAVNEADHLELVDPERLRRALDSRMRQPGVRRLRELLDRETFVMTQTQLERRFLAIVRRAELPLPNGQVRRSGHRVDFLWPDIGLVVEADSLRYHRTASKQAADKALDNANVTAGLTPLRFSHGHIRYEPDYVERVLVANFRRLQAEHERS